jgi:hypothetical protein
MGSRLVVDARNFPKLTISNPIWWFVVTACFIGGLSVARVLTGKPIFWIALAVTELIPLGLVTLFFVTVSKLKQAAEQ